MIRRRLPHPFPVQTVFRRVFGQIPVDPDTMASVLPAPILSDLYKGSAFPSIVIGQMERMRSVGTSRLGSPEFGTQVKTINTPTSTSSKRV